MAEATCPFHCGDHVYDEADPRHVGRVEAIVWMVARIKWLETGWISGVAVWKLHKAD